MSNYPDEIDSFRTLENIPGQTYDPTKLTTIFAEDLNNKGESIVAIQESLGVDLLKIYPVGSVYINASVSTNPATLLGFGTWTAIGAGRVLVGQDTGDTDFDTLGETGGSKLMQEHSHSITDPGHNHSMSAVQRGTSSPTSEALKSYDGSFIRDTSTNTTGISIDNAGAGDSENLQPYLVVKMWVRTA